MMLAATDFLFARCAEDAAEEGPRACPTRHYGAPSHGTRLPRLHAKLQHAFSPDYLPPFFLDCLY